MLELSVCSCRASVHAPGSRHHASTADADTEFPPEAEPRRANSHNTSSASAGPASRNQGRSSSTDATTLNGRNCRAQPDHDRQASANRGRARSSNSNNAATPIRSSAGSTCEEPDEDTSPKASSTYVAFRLTLLTGVRLKCLVRGAYATYPMCRARTTQVSDR